MIFYVTFDVLVDVLELFRTIPNYSELFRTKFELYFFVAVLPPNGSERFKRHRIIPNYPELIELNSNYIFFGAVLPPNGSERFRTVQNVVSSIGRW